MSDDTVLARFPAEGGDLLIRPEALEVGDGQRIRLEDIVSVQTRGAELEIREKGGGGATITLSGEEDATDAEHVITKLLSESSGDGNVTEGLEGSLGGSLGEGSPPEMP
ncbi:MAG TPA: hypothetical protein VMP42_09700 [Actinomycetota bacterium]|nr:hypothetical protein [Actinomycetota bacterium]